MYSRNFISDFFNILKFILKLFCIIGAYAPMSQNAISSLLSKKPTTIYSTLSVFLVCAKSYRRILGGASCPQPTSHPSWSNYPDNSTPRTRTHVSSQNR
jgi:hypothetical protein